jgi:ketosteroid isomerase-like protein
MSAPDVVIRYLAGLSSGDPATVLACVGDGFFNEHTSALGSSCTGKDEYAARLPGFLAQFDRLAYAIVDTITESSDDGSTNVSVRYRMTATHDGHPIDIPGVMLFEVDGGLIRRRTDVWDSLTFLRQTGAA